MRWHWHIFWVVPTGFIMLYLFLGNVPGGSGYEDCVSKARSHSDIGFCGQSNRDYVSRRDARRRTNNVAGSSIHP